MGLFAVRADNDEPSIWPVLLISVSTVQSRMVEPPGLACHGWIAAGNAPEIVAPLTSNPTETHRERCRDGPDRDL